MNSVSGPLPTSSFLKAKLLREPIYREDGELWDALRAAQDDIRHYFRQIGQELVLDDGEGFAFIRQFEMEGEERIPRLIRKRALSYHATLLLVCLREELVRFDSRADDAARLVKSLAELHALVTAFVPQSNNQVRDVIRWKAPSSDSRSLVSCARSVSTEMPLRSCVSSRLV